MSGENATSAMEKTLGQVAYEGHAASTNAVSVPDIAQLMTPEAFAEKMAKIRRKHYAFIGEAVAKDERYDQLLDEMKRHDPHARERDARDSALVKAQNVMRLSAYRLTCEFVGLVVDWHLSGLVPPEDA